MSSDSAQRELPVGQIAVLGGGPEQRRQLLEVVRGLGHDAGHDEKASDGAAEIGHDSAEAYRWTEIDVVLIVADEHDRQWASKAKTIHHDSAAPPIVVLGPPSSEWRRRALGAGAFLCGSLEAPADDLRAMLSAAIRYRSAIKENTFLRVECERICMGLLKSYGEAATSLKETTEEVEALQQNLLEIRARIIRAFV